jgi:hypothetical protein
MKARWTGPTVAVGLGILIAAAGFSAKQHVDLSGNGADLCYAFLRDGDVYLACGGPAHPVVTRRRVIAYFAVAEDGSVLAFAESRIKWVWWWPGAGTAVLDLHVVPLRGLRHNRDVAGLTNWGPLVASCGTILMAFQRSVRDVVDGSRLSVKPYSNFRCSADRKVVAGLTKKHGGLKLGLPPKELARIDGPFSYDVSRNGRYVAYVQNRRLCLTDLEGGTACTEAEPVGRFSVSDSGTVIFVRFSGGMAQGVAVWNPASNSITTLQAEGWDPQWLTPSAASALLAWAAGRSSPSAADGAQPARADRGFPACPQGGAAGP